MAITVQTDSALLVRPGAYNTPVVQTSNSGYAANGIVVLVGEADMGPRFDEETDIETSCKFSPDQLAVVQAKYGSGRLVDMFGVAAKPSIDPEIPGSPNRIVLVKTNRSTVATGALTGWTGTYGTLKAKLAGQPGNLIAYSVAAATTEVVPSTGAFTYIPVPGTVGYEMRVNGLGVVGGTLTANRQPSDFVADVTALAGVLATGGVNRSALTVSGTLLVTANPGGVGATVVDITRSIAWAAQPVAGDTLIIPMGSVVAGAGNANVGAYVVTTAGTSTLRAVKLSNAGTAATPGDPVINPVNVSPAATVSAVTDISVWSPVTISLEVADPTDGIGKSLEIAQLTTGTDLLERTAFVLGTAGAVTWVSKTTAPKLIVSAAEYKARLTVARQMDGRSEALTGGGEVALRIGYVGTTCTVTVTDTTLSTAVVGGAGINLSLALKDFPTLNDLAAYIAAQPGYVCAVGSATVGQITSLALDNVTAQGCATSFGEKNGRIKIDGYRFYNAIAEASSLVKLNDSVQADSGLPKPTTATAYLSGGARGGSSTADFTAALDKCEKLTANFIVTLVSKDSPDDVADGDTDPTSVYLVDDINAYARTHVYRCSELKRKRNRQAFVSKNGTFAEAMAAASDMAAARVALAFQDAKRSNSRGTIMQYQSFATAALAAGMQAAGFYKAFFGKAVNTSGFLMGDGSFDDRDDGQVEEALLAGLLTGARRPDGAFEFLSDQTTYSADDSFVWNSVQAIYVMDIITLTLAQRLETMYKGRSVADIGAAAILQSIDRIMADFKSKKLIAASIGAPKGYSNATVAIDGPTATIKLGAYLAGSLYFFDITTYIAPVTQRAG